MSDPYNPDHPVSRWWKEWDDYTPETRAKWEITVQKNTAFSDKLDLSRLFGETHPHSDRKFVPLERKQK